MPKNYWMVVQTVENHEISRGRGFDLHGLRSRNRRRAQRMGPEDLMLFYVSGIRKWVATASITSKYFEDRSPIWRSHGRRREEFPYRVKLAPSIVLDEEDYIDALVLGPRLEYLKRWAPEKWPLAFQDTLHLLSQKDFRLIEGEMKRVISKRRGGRRKGQSRGGRGGESVPVQAGQQEVEAEPEPDSEPDPPYSAAEGSAEGSK